MARSQLCQSALRVWVVLLTTIALSGCERPRVYDDQFLAFGTLVEVTIYGADPELAERAFDIARQDFQLMHKRWHAWRPSAVTRANSLIAAGKSFSVGPALRPLVDRSKSLSRRSRGLFNPALGRLIELWGFHRDEYGGRRPPSAAKIKALVELGPSMDDLTLTGARLSSTNPHVQLDFGAFAKGYGVGQVVEHLRDLGVENAIVNAGGDLRAIGAHGDRPWRIGIRHPRAEGVIASVELDRDESVFTSGDYERYFTFKGRRYHHILDPRTGYPARGTASVTVVHSDPSAADAAATALVVAGPDEWRTTARSMGMRNVMLIDDQGRAHMTPPMANRIQFEIEPPPPTVVEPRGS
jgi:thiamine biosynthesis lipoprotein